MRGSNRSQTYTISIGSASSRQRGLSKTEIKHLFIAFSVLTLAFAISFIGGYNGITSGLFPFYLFISFLSVGTAFLFHELAHRKLARDYGCWAEFRMWTWGLVMALAFSLMGFVFAAPGAVMIRGNVTRDQNGKISMVGPATNWLVGTLFIIGSYFALGLDYFTVGFVLAFVAFVNLIIGGFNLLPFGPLDGYKIFSWSVKNYIILAGLIVGTLAAGYFLGPLKFFF